MRKGNTAVILGLATLLTLPACAAKIKGTSTLKDSQPTGTKDKEHKHQAYDLS